MKRFLVLFFIIGFQFTSFSQHEFMYWSELGVKGKFTKKLKWSVEANTRVGEKGIHTFFPQVGIEYKILKWFRPSVEYRFLLDKNKYGNYKMSNRINLNASFKHDIKRFTLEARLRYQYSFSRFNTDSYDADFDQAIRFKPEVEYDINNSIFTPVLSVELYYNPEYGPRGPGFSKVRFAARVKLDISGPHGFSLKYIADKKVDQYSPGLRHVASFSYKYKIN